MLEIFKDPSLLSRTRAELRLSFPPTALSDAQLSSQTLVALPFLQSIYAENNVLWLPYGGGPRECIGRAFSKRAIIAAGAMMVTSFEMEILVDEKALGMDPKIYGLGGQQPMGKVPLGSGRGSSWFDDEEFLMGLVSTAGISCRQIDYCTRPGVDWV